MMKKQLLILLASLSVASIAGGALASVASSSAKAENASALAFDFTDTMDGAAFKAPQSNYGWKVLRGVLSPDNSYTEDAQIGYLEQAIALNEKKYISLDFYASACPMDIMLLPYAETVNPWATGIGVHYVSGAESDFLRLDTYIDANTGWLADYTGIGNATDGYAHKLEITSDGTNLTFKVDGVDAFTSKEVTIPADSVQLLFRAPKGSYIDNLYIGESKPSEETSAVAVDFADKMDLNGFTAAYLNGWKGGDGKYHPAEEGVTYNASAVKCNEKLDLTGKKYISFDFYAAGKPFDVALLDAAEESIWGNSLTVHIPNSDGNFSVTQNIDVGNWLGGVPANLTDGKAHTLEIFVENNKVSYKIDGVTPTLDTAATEFDIPSNEAYLVFRAVGTESYIDNLYIAESAPTELAYGFESVKDDGAFTAWNSGGFTSANGKFATTGAWSATRLTEILDLTKVEEITFDAYLSSSDADKQFNVAFIKEDCVDAATTAGSGIGYSFNTTFWVCSQLGKNGYISDVAAELFNDTWHSVKITVKDGKMSVALDGVAYETMTVDIPAEKAYLMLQSAGVDNALDNLNIQLSQNQTEEPVPVTYTVTFQNWDGTVLQAGTYLNGETPVYAGETPTREADEEYTYEFIGWDKEISAVTENVTYVAQFSQTAIEVNPYEGILENYGSGAGWTYSNEKYAPNAAWACIATVNAFDLTKNYEISFNAYLSSSDVDKQFNVGFFATKVEETNMNAGAGLCFSFGSTVWVSTNFGRNGWASECVKDYFDDSLHNIKITVYEKQITVIVDGELLYFLTNGASYVPTLTEESVYLMMQGTSTETYIQNYAVKEVEAPAACTVTFQNWDGAVLQTGTYLNGETPVYAGETPTRAADEEYTYEFIGWDKEISAVTENVTYVAQFSQTAIEVNPYEGILENYGSGAGWKYSNEKYAPNAAWACIATVNAFDLTKNYEISFNAYLSSSDADKQFNVGFFATKVEETNMNAGAGLCFSFGSTVWVSTNFGRNGWASECVKDYFDDSLHNIKITVYEKQITVIVDGELLYFLTNGASYVPTLTEESVYLMMQGTSTETYIQNYAVKEVESPAACTVTFQNWDGTVLQAGTYLNGETPVYAGETPMRAADEEYTYEFIGWDKEISAVTENATYVAQFSQTPADEAELDFTKESDGNYFQTLDVNGWAAKDGMFLPEYMPWSATYLKRPVDMSGEKYISFDFLAVKDNGDETQSQFNVMFLTDLERAACSGAIHCFMESSTPVVTVNRAMGKDQWIGTSSFNWADGKYHNLMIIIKDGTITFEIDGQPLTDRELGTQIVIELSEEQMSKTTYFGLQATNVMSRIDNFKVKNTYTEYVAPTPEEELVFEEYNQAFNAGEESGFVKYKDSVEWLVNEEGKFVPSQNWAKVYLDKEIPLTQEKTLTAKFCLSTAETGHQFTIGFSWDKNSVYGVYLIFYEGTVSINYGTAPLVRLIAQTGNTFYDGEEHILKMIVKNDKLAIVIDGEVIFRDIQVGFDSGYFTVQSSVTEDWIDDLSIVNDAEPLTTPEADGDIATPPESSEVENEVQGEVQKKTFWQKIAEFFRGIFKKIKEFFSKK